MARRAVVTGDRRLAQQGRSGDPGGVAEAEQDARLMAGLLELVLEDRKRRNADATADQDGPR
jgi:hypothetical protein